jgi:hypothetical protein
LIILIIFISFYESTKDQEELSHFWKEKLSGSTQPARVEIRCTPRVVRMYYWLGGSIGSPHPRYLYTLIQLTVNQTHLEKIASVVYLYMYRFLFL